MTTRYKQSDVTEGLTGTIHETGHALYEQGRNMADYAMDLPVNEAAGMAIHESQSLLWERMVALSMPFAEYLQPKLREKFPDAVGDRSAEDLYRAMNVVKMNNLIRVEADEVTYPMHIICRFEIERDLIEGTMAVEDVPAVWAAKMKEYLGVDVPGDAQGVLQDIHWNGMGAFAYFPTYTDSPLKPQWSRVLPVGDASGIQSPLSFGGFGALTRHLDRINTAVDEALTHDLLHKDYLGEINAYTPNLSAAWMFQKAMSVKMGQNVDPKFVNRGRL